MDMRLGGCLMLFGARCHFYLELWALLDAVKLALVFEVSYTTLRTGNTIENSQVTRLRPTPGMPS